MSTAPLELVSASLQDTQEIAARLAEVLVKPMTVCLDGSLGAGKSALARSIIHALGFVGDVPSPTFTLVQTYDVAGQDLAFRNVLHVDAYRVEQPEEALELGLVEAFGNALVIIEWAGKIASFLPEDVAVIRLEKMGSEKRRITLEGSLARAYRQRHGL